MNRTRYLNMIYNSYQTPFSHAMNASYKARQDDLDTLIKRTTELSRKYANQPTPQQHYQPAPLQQQQQNQPEFYPHHHHYQLNRSSFHNSSIKSQSSSSTATGVTIMPESSYTDIPSQYTQSSKSTKTKTSSSSPNKESILLNAVAAAAAAVNKASPQLFSKYIETVHRAMHSHRNNDPSKETVSKQQATFKPSSLPPTSLRDNYSTPYEMYTNSDQELIRSRRFVDHCRQIFEQQQQQKLLQQQLLDRQFYTLPSTTTPKVNKKKLLDEYSTNSNKPPLNHTNQSGNKQTSTSLSPVRSKANKTESTKPKIIDSNTMRASSLGFAHDYQQPSPLTYTNSYQDQSKSVPYAKPGSSHFNHFNRASYKGECKRMMAKGTMETVAERAARFEDIDIERYNRMKSKLYELELQAQQKEFEQQYRTGSQQLEQPTLQKPSNNLNKTDEQTKAAESFVTKLKNLRPVKANQTTSSDSSIVQNDQKLEQIKRDQESMWTKYEPFIAKYYTGNEFFSFWC